MIDMRQSAEVIAESTHSVDDRYSAETTEEISISRQFRRSSACPIQLRERTRVEETRNPAAGASVTANAFASFALQNTGSALPVVIVLRVQVVTGTAKIGKQPRNEIGPVLPPAGLNQLMSSLLNPC